MMVTVKEAVALLKDAKQIYIAWDGLIRELDTDSVLEMHAFGDYVLSELKARSSEDTYELVVAVNPIKKKEAIV